MHRAVLAHSKSGARMRAACIKILLLLLSYALFWFLFFGPSSSKLKAGHQLSQMARSSWLPAVCLAPSWSPALCKATFERRLCSVAWEESFHSRSAAAPLPYVGLVVVINEALVWAGNLVLTLFFPSPLCGSFLKSWWYQCYELVGESGVVASSR